HGASQTSGDGGQRDDVARHLASNVVVNVRLEQKERCEVEERGPSNRDANAQHTRRDDRRNRDGGVVTPVDERAKEHERDDRDQGDQHQVYSKTTPSRALATSSQRSVAASNCS